MLNFKYFLPVGFQIERIGHTFSGMEGVRWLSSPVDSTRDGGTWVIEAHNSKFDQTIMILVDWKDIKGISPRASRYNRGNATRARNTYKGRTSRRYGWYNDSE